MPTYEYECPDCNHRFEAVQKIVEDPLKDCPQCGGNNVRRLISATAFHLKGSGWYKTDYSSSGSSSPDASNSEASNSGDGNSSSSAETSAGTSTSQESKPSPATEKKSDSKPEKKTSSASSS